MGITQKTEAVGMYSAEGEFVEFGHSVLLEGPVEVRFDSVKPGPVVICLLLENKQTNKNKMCNLIQNSETSYLY